MRNCKNCVYCKEDLLSDYIQEADFYKCDMDNDVILDPLKEGRDCTWFRDRTQKTSLKKKVARWLKRLEN